MTIKEAEKNILVVFEEYLKRIGHLFYGLRRSELVWFTVITE